MSPQTSKVEQRTMMQRFHYVRQRLKEIKVEGDRLRTELAGLRSRIALERAEKKK